MNKLTTLCLSLALLLGLALTARAQDLEWPGDSWTDNEQPVADQPAPDQPAPEQPAPEQPVADQPAPEQPAPEQPVADQPAPEQPAPEQPTTEQPVADQPAPEQPAPEQPANQEPAAAANNAYAAPEADGISASGPWGDVVIPEDQIPTGIDPTPTGNNIWQIVLPTLASSGSLVSSDRDISDAQRRDLENEAIRRALDGFLEGNVVHDFDGSYDGFANSKTAAAAAIEACNAVNFPNVCTLVNQGEASRWDGEVDCHIRAVHEVYNGGTPGDEIRFEGQCRLMGQYKFEFDVTFP